MPGIDESNPNSANVGISESTVGNKVIKDASEYQAMVPVVGVVKTSGVITSFSHATREYEPHGGSNAGFVGIAFTETVVASVSVIPLTSVTVTVYACVEVGEAMGLGIVVEDNPVAGLHE